ncbi:MAG: hypothetical protein K0S78_599 [Thermomicrobiales bacterium]|jgi:hypothetical protein|nr:hypothetical protein [Thermomicrobiales bacterium]MDF3039227.1 hypothetical protein [Thermomicrobiales bacterium]
MHAIARPLVLVALVTGWASLVAPAPVLAQDTGVVVIPVASPVAGETILITNDPTATALDPAMVLALVLVLLLIALFALSEIFRYLRDGREDYYRTFREFARRGVYVEPVIVNATAALASTVRTQGAEGLEEAAGPTTLFRVNGPGMIATGQSGTFEAFLGEQPATETVWVLSKPDGSAVPMQDATLTPERGASATFSAAKPGVYVLTATPAAGANMQVQTTINVVAPPPADSGVPKLPFIGEGYGSIVGAILLLAVVVVLAATRAIDADIVGVLLGSIAGYLFGVGISRNTS